MVEPCPGRGGLLCQCEARPPPDRRILLIEERSHRSDKACEFRVVRESADAASLNMRRLIVNRFRDDAIDPPRGDPLELTVRQVVDDPFRQTRHTRNGLPLSGGNAVYLRDGQPECVTALWLSPMGRVRI